MKTIIWDVDDVLNDLTRAWFEDWLRSSGTGCSLKYDQLACNPPHELLGITHAEFLASLDAFRLSGKARDLPPFPETLDWFARYGNRCHHLALTATPLLAGHVSAEWVMRHFARWIRSFGITPSPRPGWPNDHHAAKSDFLLWWGKGDILVDDSPANVAGALALGMDAVLFPRPWNRSEPSIGEALEELTLKAFGEPPATMR
ncbi:MAG: hypothetical protein LLG06_18930 [Desulfobacteraceae bacterium]|nr:hypothetical protein [Desulfobacteraceae bacterium]